MVKDIDFYYKRSRLNQLRGFCSVVQNGCSIVRASEKTNVEADTISKQVRSLERDLGITLIDRSKHNSLSLTPEGQLFYDSAVKQLNGLTSLFETFNEHLREYSNNHLNIALHYMAATYIFPKIVAKLLEQERFKNIKINISETTKSEALKKLENKEVDLIYFPFDVDDNRLNQFDHIKSIKHNHALILSKKHPLADNKTITMEDLSKYNFIVRGSKISFATDKYDLKHSNISLDDCSIDTSVELALSTNSITAIPEEMFRHGNLKYDKNIVCKNVNHLFKTAHLHLLTLKNSIKKDSVGFIVSEIEKLNSNN